MDVDLANASIHNTMEVRALHELPAGLGPNSHNRLVAPFPVLKTKTFQAIPSGNG